MRYMLHTNLSTMLLGNWYKAPDEDVSSINNLQAEIMRLRGDNIGVILVGDVNVHHSRWLHFSSSNTGMGDLSWDVCKDLLV